jgi:division protein CdvB (Snf7/Vps24/ESCRT-III family)
MSTSTRNAQPSVKRLWQQINRLSGDVERMKKQVEELMRGHPAPLTAPEDEDLDNELRSLVGTDPPLSLRKERKELRRIVVRRHGAG